VNNLQNLKKLTMVKNVLVIMVLALICTASWKCSKEKNSSCSPVPVENEDATMLQYISSKNINAIKDSTGLYYEVISEGTGARPTQNSRIAVKYAGYLTSGTKFDESNTPPASPANWWPLGGLIRGWQIGLPKIKKGGKIKLIIPSSMGYGCEALGSIPANSILVFDVELVDFN
jgi:FKBP-type peptidyl-prolyl cis-trans isomerase FkpA